LADEVQVDQTGEVAVERGAAVPGDEGAIERGAAVPAAEVAIERGAAVPGDEIAADLPEIVAAADEVIVLDFGSQTAQLIARRVRELNVYSELLPFDTPWSDIAPRKPKALILSGGPSSVYEAGSPHPDPAIWTAGIPILGICYGMHLMAHHLGGQVRNFSRKEFGPAVVEIAEASGAAGHDGGGHEIGIFASLDRDQPVWMSHGDSIETLPTGFHSTASTTSTPIAAVADPARRFYGIQFHPEVVHTRSGKQILANFVLGVAGARPSWTAANFIASTVDEIRRRVDDHSRATGTDGRVLCALSGGVDSAVAATLVHRAVGDRLTCVHVDHGMMRKNETELLKSAFDQLGVKTVIVDARERFLRKLEGVTDPERKRHIIGNEFIRVFEEEAARLGQIDFLTQGTLYPDVIESATSVKEKAAVKIKTHHNVGGLPDDITFKLIEPLRYLFKDEVRAVGTELGLPDSMVQRQPFPGPGLGIRIIGEITQERLDTLREADWIVMDEIKNAGLYNEIWQSFAILTPLRSVGVMGDGRTYANVVAIRAVTSEDAMTADWAKLPYELLARISSRIVNEVAGVNRVVYDISSKPPATIEWE
jgi:GMP synthase (glutamine-hydrolysing)